MLSQNSGVVLKNLPSRRAVSVLIPILSATIRSMRVRGTCKLIGQCVGRHFERLRRARAGFHRVDRWQEIIQLHRMNPFR